MIAMHIPKLADLHGLLAALAAVFMLSMTGIFFWFLPIPRTAVVKECDRQVAILFSTQDEIELQRAMFLIRQLPCSIGRRL